MLPLELLAPARTLDIGIAAIDCGADAVYIAGPAFGARQAAGNSVEDIAALCAYARPFGVRIFVTLNTLLYEDELPEAGRLIRALEAAGVDALIVQDLAVLPLSRQAGGEGAAQGGAARICEGVPAGEDPAGRPVGATEGLPLHASTQCAIRTPEDARRYEALGFSRLVLERELSLAQIRAIREAVSCELECFVHGALCVCYSGQCYLSEALTGRSANRGACAQPCRSRYDLLDLDGRELVHNKALLSLKDFRLLERLGELAGAGVCSFKIEGRLKGASYVKNTVRAYSDALDALVRACPDRYCRASFGRVAGGFVPDLGKTFNRSYTELYFDGTRRRGWSSMDAPTSLGEKVGQVREVRPARQGVGALSGKGAPLRQDAGATPSRGTEIRLEGMPPGVRLHNGDGFAFLAPDGEIVGFRGDVCDGSLIRCSGAEGLRSGLTLYRNSDSAFEKTVESGRCTREIPVTVTAAFREGRLCLSARSADGRTARLEQPVDGEPARDVAQLAERLRTQLGKRAGRFSFAVTDIQLGDGPVPMPKAAFLNALRRDLAAALDALPVRKLPLAGATPTDTPADEPADAAALVSTDASVSLAAPALFPATATYKDNIANSLARACYRAHGTSQCEDAYELTHPRGAELMRTRYCIRFETGRCPFRQGGLGNRSDDSAPGTGLSGQHSLDGSQSATLSSQSTPQSRKGDGSAPGAAPLLLRNNGRLLLLRFDCRRCEMTVSEAPENLPR